MYTLQLSSFVLRRVNTNYAPNGSRLASLRGQCNNSAKYTGYRKKISVWVREQSEQVAEACTRQFEFIVAQRIRRSIQMFHLYTRIWDEVALKAFMKSWGRKLERSAKHFLLSAVGVTVYNWDHERISDEELNSYKAEIKGIHKLMNSTVVCGNCHLRIMIDVCQPGIKYCKCNGITPTATSMQDPNGWQPFIEPEDMLIWRRQEPDSGGLFAYKVYGNFSDVTAEDFLQVQIDVDYRKEWDPTAQELQVIDTDPKSSSSRDHSTDVIYWEMIWPRLFANRDYVYQRRWIVDRDERTIVIISRVTEHPNAPSRPGVYRVTSYWSYMVIRPYTEFHEPGIEFGLTYFDDPGVNIPAAVTTWVTMAGLPDFLIRMRQASKGYQEYRMMKRSTTGCNTDYVPLNDGVVEEERETMVNTGQRMRNAEMLKDEGRNEHEKVDKEDALAENTRKQSKVETAKDTDNSTSEKDKGLFNYFFLTKLFP